MKWILSISAFILLVLITGCGKQKEERFVIGVVFEPSPQTLERDISLMNELGITHVKFWMNWSSIQKKYGLNSLDWEWWDIVIEKLVENGIQPVPLICDATTAPYLENRTRISPENEGICKELCNENGCITYCGVGRENYINEAKKHARAIAERYKGKVYLFNIENELNWTCVHVLIAGWRAGDIWCDLTFVKELLEGIIEGVKDGNPTALTTMNFNVHHPLFVEQVKFMGNLLDISGIGAYPNYIGSTPTLGHLLGYYVRIMKSITKKSVMVMETGYPSGPHHEGYSEELQADYLTDAIISSIESGAEGFFYLKLRDPSTEFEGIKRVEKFWGLVDKNFNPKTSFYKYKDLIAELKNTQTMCVHRN